MYKSDGRKAVRAFFNHNFSAFVVNLVSQIVLSKGVTVGVREGRVVIAGKEG